MSIVEVKLIGIAVDKGTLVHELSFPLLQKHELFQVLSLDISSRLFFIFFPDQNPFTAI
jgi:hypothetical protein